MKHAMRVIVSSIGALLLLAARTQADPAERRQTECPVSAVVCDASQAAGFGLIDGGQPAAIFVDADDFEGVGIAARNLHEDLGRLGGREGGWSLRAEPDPIGDAVILVGTIGRSDPIDGLIARGKLDVSGVVGGWEAFLTTVVDSPMDGVDSALVIAGADQRGTIFGIYDLIERAGVSPWHWWADVAVPERTDLVVTPHTRLDRPVVKYRGIFLNDENPALYDWVHATYGGFNNAFYARVFELILRQKGNYLWPAMWGKAFYDDDPENGLTAQRHGIVIGTSHHEPLMRAHVEWERHGEGPWDYTVNADALREFWRAGMERVAGQEVLVTIGMRGDGDEAMTEGTAIDLLETIVADQREIIADVTGKLAEDQPQVWALYKEVQDYHDQGMDVPDDVLLLFSDDNWGNIRRLPAPGEARPGGYGIYYHFDYVGAPRNYKWLNVSQVERIWEQMDMAWRYGADRLWIANVGDLKPMELPISFFLDQAWDPAAMTLSRMDGFTAAWAARQFGPDHAGEIAALLDGYTRFNSRRTPELLDSRTYSAVNFEEWDRVAADYRALAETADRIRAALPARHDDAFVQLVWFPVQASANLYQLYRAVALNRLHAAQGRSDANAMADLAERYYARDAELTRIYHEDVAGGKWTGMMGQTHIGYTYWQQPETQTMPEVQRIKPLPGAQMGVALAGLTGGWPGSAEAPRLGEVSPYGTQAAYIEIFNRGSEAFTAEVTSSAPWLDVSHRTLEIEGKTRRVDIAPDWDKVPAGRTVATLLVAGAGRSVEVKVPVFRPWAGTPVQGYVEAEGVVSIPASGFDRAVAADGVEWTVLPSLGRRGSSVAAFPRPFEAFEPGADSPRLEYDVHTFSRGEASLHVVLEPSFDVAGKGGTLFAVSVDDGAPVLVNANGDFFPNDPTHPVWPKAVANSAVVRTVPVDIGTAGPHTVKLWLVDPGLVFQEIWLETGDMPDTYLGPPASLRAGTGAQQRPGACPAGPEGACADDPITGEP